jgi:hypothetical protein
MYERNEFLKVLIKLKSPGKFQGLLVAGIVPMAIGIEPMTTVAGMSIMSY